MARDRPLHPHLRRAGTPARSATQRPHTSTGPGNAARASAHGHGAEAERAALLGHITARLGAIRTAQQREVAAMDPQAQRDWYRAVADSHVPEATKPDPARWHRAASLFARAADALARGDLQRGLGLVRMAEDAEREAFDATSSVVDLDGVARPDAEPAGRTATVGVLRAMAVPEAIRLTAAAIERTRPWIDDPPVKPLDERAPGPAREDDEEDDGTATGE